jgi:hypothetical protein
VLLFGLVPFDPVLAELYCLYRLGVACQFGLRRVILHYVIEENASAIAAECDLSTVMADSDTGQRLLSLDPLTDLTHPSIHKVDTPINPTSQEHPPEPGIVGQPGGTELVAGQLRDQRGFDEVVEEQAACVGDCGEQVGVGGGQLELPVVLAGQHWQRVRQPACLGVEQDGAALAAGGQSPVLPAQAGHLAAVVLDAASEAVGLQVPHPHQPVPAPRGHPQRIFGKGQAPRDPLHGHLPDLAIAIRVAEHDFAVQAGRHDQFVWSGLDRWG